jgi:hypothetical protein
LGWLVVIIANCWIICVCSLLRCALKIAVFASLEAFDCVRTDADRLAM